LPKKVTLSGYPAGKCGAKKNDEGPGLWDEDRASRAAQVQSPDLSARHTPASRSEIQKSALEFLFSQARLAQTSLQSEQS
jgi:hypothetical protein